MDSSGEELGRIVAFVNRRPWIMEASGGEDHKSNYYLDTLGVTPEGDTSLHRLCAWHATLGQLEDFLGHYHQDTQADLGMPTPSLVQANHHGVTCLHLAVFRNSYHASEIIQHLLSLEPSLASTPMNCGSYPLHVLCGHNVTLQKEVLMALLQADPSVVLKQDQNGDTPLSLLWKNVQRFRWARQEHIPLDSTQSHNTIQTKTSWVGQMTISPEQCMDFSLQMVRAALQKPLRSPLTLADLCAMPRCPPLFIRLALEHCDRLQLDLYGRDASGRTALHHAALQEPMTHLFALPRTNTKSVLEWLLQAVPCLARAKDRQGRIPLHYALAKQYPLDYMTQQTLDSLVWANPDSLCAKDPVTALYPFALVATGSGEVDADCPMRDEEEEAAYLSAIVRLLRQFPEAAVYEG